MQSGFEAQIRNELLKTQEKLNSFITTLTNNDRMEYYKFVLQAGEINNALLEISRKISQLEFENLMRESPSSRLNSKYKRAWKELHKILVKMMIDTGEIRKKQVTDKLWGFNSQSWERLFQKGKLRKDLINHFKDVSKQLEKLRKNI